MGWGCRRARLPDGGRWTDADFLPVRDHLVRVPQVVVLPYSSHVIAAAGTVDSGRACSVTFKHHLSGTHPFNCQVSENSLVF